MNTQIVGNVIIAIKDLWSSLEYTYYNQYNVPDIIKITLGHKVFFLGNKDPRISFDLDFHVKGGNDGY